MHIAPRAVAVAFCLATGVGCANSSDHEQPGSAAQRQPVDLSAEWAAWREQKKATGGRWSAVLEETEAATDVPWAGTYYAGDGLGYNLHLSLAPRTGFVYEINGCVGRYDQNLGAVEAIGNGGLLLRPELPPLRDRVFRGDVGGEYVFVRWGERRYLIRSNEVDAFRNAVARGDEPRRRLHGHFLLAVNDHTKPATGEPDLPADRQLATTSPGRSATR